WAPLLPYTTLFRSVGDTRLPGAGAGNPPGPLRAVAGPRPPAASAAGPPSPAVRERVLRAGRPRSEGRPIGARGSADPAVAVEPVLRGEGRHAHALMRDARHDDTGPAAGHAELGGLRLAPREVELRPREAVRSLRHRGFVFGKILGGPVDVLVAGKNDQGIAEKPTHI